MNIQGGPIGGDYQYIAEAAHLFVEPISDTRALFTVSWNREPHLDLPLITATNLDIYGSRTVDSLTKSAASRQRWDGWDLFFRDCLHRIIRHLRDPGNGSRVTDIEEQPDLAWIINPLVGDFRWTTFLAERSSGKSYLATAASIAVAADNHQVLGNYTPQLTGPVFYLDWEAEASTFRRRVGQLSRGVDTPPPKDLWHFEQTRPLWMTARGWARVAAEHGARLIIIDSVNPARGFGDSSMGGAGDTLKFYEALNQIGVPALLVDHVAEGDKRGKRGPFGSSVNANMARLIWNVASDPHGDVIHQTLSINKANDLPKTLPAINLAIRFEDRAVRITRERERVSAITSAKDLIREHLNGGGTGTYKDIAAATGLDPKVVSARLSELRGSGHAVEFDGVWHALGQ